MTDLNLTEAIKAVLPHASRDYTLPVLTNVCATHDAVLATDRYTLARVTVPTGVKEGDQLLIPRELAAMGVSSVTPSNGGYTITTALPAAIKRHNPKMAAPTWFLPVEGGPEFPDLGRLIDGWKGANMKTEVPAEGDMEGPYGSFNVDAAFLARWSPRHFSRGLRGLTVELGATPLRPLRITVGNVDNYVSLLVPTRTFQ